MKITADDSKPLRSAVKREKAAKALLAVQQYCEQYCSVSSENMFEAELWEELVQRFHKYTCSSYLGKCTDH